MTLDLASPRIGMGRIERVLVSYGIGLLFSLAGVGVVWGMLAFWVPHCVDVFKDFKTSLPWLTEVVMGFSYFVCNPLGELLVLFLVPALPVLPALFVGFPEDRRDRFRRGRMVAALWVLLVVMTCGLVYGTMKLPMMKLLQSVQDGGGDKGEGG